MCKRQLIFVISFIARKGFTPKVINCLTMGRIPFYYCRHQLKLETNTNAYTNSLVELFIYLFHMLNS